LTFILKTSDPEMSLAELGVTIGVSRLRPDGVHITEARHRSIGVRDASSSVTGGVSACIGVVCQVKR
jgi:hypothetical protein